MNIQEFIEQHGLTMEYIRIPARTDRAANEWDKDAFHYLVTIKNKNVKAFAFPYSMGYGHVEKVPLSVLRTKGHGGLSQKDYDRIPKPGVKGVSLFMDDLRRDAWKPKAPQLPDVLDCLASDCSGFDNSRSFEDWASDYGYDTDSRKAERIYDAIRNTFRAMENLLGRDALKTLMYDVDRL